MNTRQTLILNKLLFGIFISVCVIVPRSAVAIQSPHISMSQMEYRPLTIDKQMQSIDIELSNTQLAEDTRQAMLTKRSAMLREKIELTRSIELGNTVKKAQHVLYTAPASTSASQSQERDK